ncbi:FAD binding domain-containing protein [Nonomuraea fuscirosea]|uniref:FAD binding domain-containing protein n=2 Tax=Nonomuraea fuscirosea TaxID=1291556 RepID=A0A2T0MQE1_9ACTN|nr:FAD binding domain-containing protein [Nonomuraea fuscirosea]
MGTDDLRDFRGDTVHASTVRLMDELVLGDAFCAIPQSKLGTLGMPAPRRGPSRAERLRKPARPYNHVAMIPQREFLDFLANTSRHEPTFTIRMSTEVTGLIKESGQVVGVRTREQDGVAQEIRADLTVAGDGRYSIVCRQSGPGTQSGLASRARPLQGSPRNVPMTAPSTSPSARSPAFILSLSRQQDGDLRGSLDDSAPFVRVFESIRRVVLGYFRRIRAFDKHDGFISDCRHSG